MIPELTQIRAALRNYETQYEQILNNTQNLKIQFLSLQQSYNTLQDKYKDLEFKYNKLLNDRQDTDTKKPQETVPEVQN